MTSVTVLSMSRNSYHIGTYVHKKDLSLMTSFAYPPPDYLMPTPHVGLGVISYILRRRNTEPIDEKKQSQYISYGQLIQLVHKRGLALCLGLRDVVLLFQLFALLVGTVAVVVRHAAVLLVTCNRQLCKT